MHVASRSILSSLAALALAAVAPSAAQAQTTTFDVPANKKWQHAQTGLIVPQALGGLPRTAITAEGGGELDIAVQIGDVNTTQATLYLFRPALMSVPLWFDRVETQVLQRGAYGNAAVVDTPTGFAVPRGTATSALRRIYKPGKPPYTATGVAVLPLGDWLVVVRLSSTVLSPADLDGKLSAVIADLGWPTPLSNTPESPAAVPVQPCATPLTYDAKAKLQKPDMTAGILGSLLAMAASNSKDTDKTDSTPAVFCREGEPQSERGVYRSEPLDSTSYVIAIADAGRTIWVHPDLQLDEKKKQTFGVTLNTLDRTYVFPSFDRLPAPDKVMQALAKAQPVSSTERGSKTINIQSQ
jgi:hypothetical protein